jgi:serine/threonine-protein kinase
MARVSTRFGRYDLLRPIGRGGMAEVFLARYAGPEGFEKLLVIKRVLPKISESTQLLRMFFEEAKTQVSFSQGNLVSVFDFGRVDNEYFIAMDYVRGADLASLFAANRPLAPALLAHVGVEICRGLAYVHARGFVHRDVTPRNVLLSVDGEVKLSDFGLALAVQEQGVQGRQGTPSYMAPEQARGDRTDARADIYSLGLVLAEGLLGRGVRGDPARDAGSVRADVATHGPLGAILARAVAASPDERFGGAEEMLAALEAESGRSGVGREGLVRELAAKVSGLAPAADATFAAPRAVTAPTAAETPARESYFRDTRSPGFVETMLEAAPAVPRRRALRGVAALAGAAAITLGVLALRSSGVGEAAPPAAATIASAAAPEVGPPAREPAPSPAPSPAAAPIAAAPAPDVARGATRARAPQPTGKVRVLCTPWCIPYVDGKAVGVDGRSFSVRVPAGRHRVEARRLDDRLQRQLDVAPGQEQSAHFNFD